MNNLLARKALCTFAFILLCMSSDFVIAANPYHPELVTGAVPAGYYNNRNQAELSQSVERYRRAFVDGDPFVRGLFSISNQVEMINEYIHLGEFDRAHKEYKKIDAFCRHYSNEICNVITLYCDETDWFAARLHQCAMICFGRRFAYELVKTPIKLVMREEFFDPNGEYQRMRAMAVDSLFKKAGMTSEMKAAYIAYETRQDKNRDDSDVQLILNFLPKNIHLYGLPNHGEIVYPTGHFVGRKGNVDRRCSDIVRHIWNRKNFYKDCFSDSLSVRFFLSRLWMIEDDHSMFLDHLKQVEKKIQSYVSRYGKINKGTNPWSNGAQMIAYEDLFAKIAKPWNYLRSMRGRVRKIIDGDTIVVCPSHTHEDIVVVRLDKIDAPENEQTFGEEARRYLESLILNSDVTVYYSTSDSYGRIVGTIVSADSVNVNLRLVSEGFAWHYKEYDQSSDFSAAESSARYYELNLWSEPHIKPSEWRLKHITDCSR